MVVLVRCIDNTCSLALETRLDELIDDGLIAAFFRDGRWVGTDSTPRKYNHIHACRPEERLMAMVSSF